MIDLIAVKRGWPTLGADVSNAFFHAEEKEEVYVKPAAEWIEEDPDARVGMMWKLCRQLQGRRKAP